MPCCACTAAIGLFRAGGDLGNLWKLNRGTPKNLHTKLVMKEDVKCSNIFPHEMILQAPARSLQARRERRPDLERDFLRQFFHPYC